MNRLKLLFGVLIMWSCTDDNTVFNDNHEFENAKWAIKETCKFKVDITDAKIDYVLYYNVRNALDYPYYNLYVTRYVYDEKGKKIEEKLSELILADDKTGKMLGSGLGDIFDHKILINKGYRFPRPGKYTIEVKQYMRQDPLPSVVSFGIALKKKQD